MSTHHNKHNTVITKISNGKYEAQKSRKKIPKLIGNDRHVRDTLIWSRLGEREELLGWPVNSLGIFHKLWQETPNFLANPITGIDLTSNSQTKKKKKEYNQFLIILQYISNLSVRIFFLIHILNSLEHCETVIKLLRGIWAVEQGELITLITFVTWQLFRKII